MNLSFQDPRDDQLRLWLAKASSLITARVADARAHGEAGRTLDATSRLNELRKALADDVAGEDSLLAQARTIFYRRAFDAEPFDVTVHRDVRPDAEGELAARYALIGGRNQYVDVRQSFDTAAVQLRGLSDKAAADYRDSAVEFWSTAFDVWQKRTTETLTRRMHVTLSDAQMALSGAVARVRIKPELLDVPE
jgi:hypothetical protein